MKSCLITAVSQPLPGFFAAKPLNESECAAPAAARHGNVFRQVLPEADWACAIYHTAATLSEDWDRTAPKDNFFLSKTYLHAVESYAPEGMNFAYLLFYHQEKPVGVAYCQFLTFNPVHHIQGLSEPNPNIAQWFKQRVAASLSMPVLICGNMLLTGAHAFHFDEKQVSAATGARMLEASAQLLSKGQGISGLGASAILMKDFEAEHLPFTKALKEERFHEIHFQPNMRMTLRPEWRNFEDYLSAMSSKYRIRARRAFKKLDGVQRHEIDAATAQQLDPQLHALYRSVANHANFNMVQLHPQYFSGMKMALGNRFKMWGYFLDDKLIGFNTAIYNGKEMEAHFLGFEDVYNFDFQLYLNMLYDIVKEAFKSENRHIVFSRTATEIKSSIGAEAFETCCYLRHRNPLINGIARGLVAYLSPHEDWIARHPFREETVDSELA